MNAPARLAGRRFFTEKERRPQPALSLAANNGAACAANSAERPHAPHNAGAGQLPSSRRSRPAIVPPQEGRGSHRVYSNFRRLPAGTLTDRIDFTNHAPKARLRMHSKANRLAMARLKPLLQIDLRPVEAPDCATPGAQVFMLLPRLEKVLGIAPHALGRPIGTSLCAVRDPSSQARPRLLH